MRHELKTWPAPFHAVWKGTKKFEVRVNDRGFQVGHKLLLREWCEDTYSGREIYTEITYMTEGPNWGLPAHLAVLSLGVVRCSGAGR